MFLSTSIIEVRTAIRVFLLSVILAPSGCHDIAGLQEKSAKDGGADIVVCDIGSVLPGLRVSKSVRVENNTGANWSIAKVEATCGCVSIENVPRQIAIGQSATIEVRYSAKQSLGADSQTLWFISDSRDSPLFGIQVNAKVWDPVVIADNPVRISVSSRQVGQELVGVFDVINHGDDRISIGDVTSKASWLTKVTADAISETKSAQQVYRVNFIVDTKQLDYGLFTGEVEFAIYSGSEGDPKSRTRRVQVQIAVERGTKVIPASVFAGSVRSDRVVESRFVIKTDTFHEISSIEVPERYKKQSSIGISRLNDSVSQVLIRFEPGSHRGYIHMDLLVRISRGNTNQDTVTVPFDAYVEDESDSGLVTGEKQ